MHQVGARHDHHKVHFGTGRRGVKPLNSPPFGPHLFRRPSAVMNKDYAAMKGAASESPRGPISIDQETLDIVQNV